MAPVRRHAAAPAPSIAERPAAVPGAAEVMAKAAHENFPVASALLGPATRRHLLAVYGFARLVDDLGDEAAGDREALLDWLEHELELAYAGTPTHPLMQRLAATIGERSLPRRPFERLIAANRQDQRVARYASFAELAAYCELSANPVGELVLHVFGAADQRRVRLSDAVCTGLQLVEHWQDVREDAERGRIYLPQEDLDRFGVGERDLHAESAAPPLRALMAFEVARARALLLAGAPLTRRLRGRQGLAVALFVAGGLAALDAIERARCDVLARAPRPSRLLLARALVRALRASRKAA
jgi:squalene synthase HpnC